MGLLVAGTKYRGEFEERLKKLMDEIKQNDDIILMIDEVRAPRHGRMAARPHGWGGVIRRQQEHAPRRAADPPELGLGLFLFLHCAGRGMTSGGWRLRAGAHAHRRRCGGGRD